MASDSRKMNLQQRDAAGTTGLMNSRRALLGGAMGLALLFGAPLQAETSAGSVARLARPTRPTSTQAHSTAASTLSQKAPAELLALSAAALAQTSSYQFSGPASVSGAAPKGGKKTVSSLDLSGAFQKPTQNYSRAALKGQTASASFESYSDGKNLYVKTSTSKKAGTWQVTSQPASAQGNPFAALQLASTSVSTVTAGADATLNGKTYITLNAVLKEDAARELLASLLSASGYDISTPANASSKVEATLTYYLDPTTFLSEACHLAGSQTVSLSTGKSIKVAVSADQNLKGVNQPVTMPDVSGATTRQQ